MESLQQEEVQQLKMHVHNFSKENTQLTKDNGALKEKAQMYDLLEQRMQDLQSSLAKEKELNEALTQAQEDDDSDAANNVFKT